MEGLRSPLRLSPELPSQFLHHIHTTSVRQREGQDFYSRRRPEVKVDGQCWTTYFFDLPNNLMEGDGGYQWPQLPLFWARSSSTAATLGIETVVAAVLTVREEEAADEFRPEPAPEEVEDARLRGAVGPKTNLAGQSNSGELPRWC